MKIGKLVQVLGCCLIALALSSFASAASIVATAPVVAVGQGAAVTANAVGPFPPAVTITSTPIVDEIGMPVGMESVTQAIAVTPGTPDVPPGSGADNDLTWTVTNGLATPIYSYNVLPSPVPLPAGVAFGTTPMASVPGAFAFAADGTLVFTPATAVAPGAVVVLSYNYTGGAAGPAFPTSLTLTVNPEPTSMCLAGLGMVVAGGGGYLRRRRKQKKQQQQ